MMADVDRLEYQVREGGPNEPGPQKSQEAIKMQKKVGIQIQFDLQEMQKAMYDQQTKKIREQLIEEQKQREQKLERFLGAQQADLDQKLFQKAQNDPRRIEDLKNKKKDIKTKIKARLVTGMKQGNPNWQEELDRKVFQKMENLTDEEILNGVTILPMPKQVVNKDFR